MPRILGIDYGTKRVGLSATDPLKIIVTGLTTVPTKEVISYLENYLKEEEVESFVIGEPLHKDGTPTYLEEEIRLFIEKLHKQFPGIPVERQEERYTSKEATEIIRKSGVNKKKRREKGLVDKISAVLILQDFLNHR